VRITLHTVLPVCLRLCVYAVFYLFPASVIQHGLRFVYTRCLTFLFTWFAAARLRTAHCTFGCTTQVPVRCAHLRFTLHPRYHLVLYLRLRYSCYGSRGTARLPHTLRHFAVYTHILLPRFTRLPRDTYYGCHTPLPFGHMVCWLVTFTTHLFRTHVWFFGHFAVCCVTLVALHPHHTFGFCCCCHLPVTPVAHLRYYALRDTHTAPVTVTRLPLPRLVLTFCPRWFTRYRTRSLFGTHRTFTLRLFPTAFGSTPVVVPLRFTVPACRGCFGSFVAVTAHTVATTFAVAVTRTLPVYVLFTYLPSIYPFTMPRIYLRYLCCSRCRSGLQTTAVCGGSCVHTRWFNAVARHAFFCRCSGYLYAGRLLVTLGSCPLLRFTFTHDGSLRLPTPFTHTRFILYILFWLPFTRLRLPHYWFHCYLYYVTAFIYYIPLYHVVVTPHAFPTLPLPLPRFTFPTVTHTHLHFRWLPFLFCPVTTLHFTLRFHTVHTRGSPLRLHWLLVSCVFTLRFGCLVGLHCTFCRLHGLRFAFGFAFTHYVVAFTFLHGCCRLVPLYDICLVLTTLVGCYTRTLCTHVYGSIFADFLTCVLHARFLDMRLRSLRFTVTYRVYGCFLCVHTTALWLRFHARFAHVPHLRFAVGSTTYAVVPVLPHGSLGSHRLVVHGLHCGSHRRGWFTVLCCRFALRFPTVSYSCICPFVRLFVTLRLLRFHPTFLLYTFTGYGLLVGPAPVGWLVGIQVRLPVLRCCGLFTAVVATGCVSGCQLPRFVYRFVTHTHLVAVRLCYHVTVYTRLYRARLCLTVCPHTTVVTYLPRLTGCPRLQLPLYTGC